MKALLFVFAFTCSAILGMAQSANLKTVMDNYARFGQGDVPGILATLADNVVWSHPGNPAIVPYAGTFNGQAGAGQFFERVGSSVQITVFQPSNFRENGNMVSNDIRIEGTVPATGKTFASNAVFHWTFGPDGKAVRWEAAFDPQTLEAAFTR